MSNIDEDEILELEISDDETFGLHGVGSPGKKRKVAEEVPDTGFLVERTVTLLPNSMVTLPPPSVPAKLSFMQYIQSSFSSSSRVNIYRSRIPLVYPETAVSDTRLIRFVPSEDGSDREDDTDTYYDSGIHSLVEEDYGRSAKTWPRKRDLGPTPVPSFVDIAWNDRLGREFAENNLTSYEPRQMVHLSRSDALKLIAKSGPLYYDANSSGDRNTCQVKSGNHINSEALKTFLLSVDEWRVLCFDTESNGTMLYKVEPNKGNPGRIPIVFGNPAGQVLVFHDSRQTPQELKDRCADFRYVKFQSGAEHDLAHLKKNGFSEFRGVVDVQTLITLIRPATKQSGIEFCTQYVWGDDKERNEYETGYVRVNVPRKSKIRIDWSTGFEPFYEREHWKGFSLYHSCQDVLTPYAILVKIALEITGLRGQAENEHENIFITMNEALELCLSKAPADIRNPNNGSLARVVEGEKLVNWINDDAVEHCTPFQFNSHALVQRIRRARADLVESHVNELRWDEIQTLALHHLDLLNGRMPFSNELKFVDLRFHIMDHCAHCGSLEHRSEACVERTFPCCYDHGPGLDLPAHSIVCCPALHAYCHRCCIRGHFAESHGKGWKSAAQLRRQFMEFAAQGLYTSLLYLIRTEKTAKTIQPHHFRLGLTGRRLAQAYGDYWLFGGLGYIPEDEKAKGDIYREIAKRNLMATPLTYELLKIVEEVTAEQRAKDILIAKGSIVAGKRLSGAQRRKRRQLTLELEAEDRKKKDKDVLICPE